MSDQKINVKVVPEPEEPEEPEESESDDSESEDSDSSESDSGSESENDEKKYIPSLRPFIRRKAFPFCFWYMLPVKKDLGVRPKSKDMMKQAEAAGRWIKHMIFIENLKNVVGEVIELLLEIDDVAVYTIQGNREQDRLRVICPDVFVTAGTAIDLRNLILGRLGYKENAEIIPSTAFYYETVPTVLFPRQKDIGTGKWESHQTYKDVVATDEKTEDLERMMIKAVSYDDKHPPKPLEFTDQYKEFLELRKKEGDDSDPDGQEDNGEEQKEMGAFSALSRGNPTSILFTEKVSADIKKKLGKKVEECIKWFHKYHPDAKLRFVRELDQEGKVFLFDFTKSSKKCRLCDLIHNSNRQYLVYSSKSEKVFYHCHDTNAREKSLAFSLKGRKRGSRIVRVNDVDSD
jgi:hypothetical protein